MTPFILIALIICVTLLMMLLGIGPFGHPAQLHWHMKLRNWPKPVQLAIKTSTVFCLVLAVLQLICITDL